MAVSARAAPVLTPDGVITVRGFSFCKTHGDEVCERCGNWDFRKNNATPDLVSKVFCRMRRHVDIFARASLNVFHCGAVTVPTGPHAGNLVCRMHGAAECNTCFDWVTYIVAFVQGGKIQDREVLNDLLTAMGLVIPQGRRMPGGLYSVDGLDGMLAKAILLAQGFDGLNIQTILPENLPPWKYKDPNLAALGAAFGMPAFAAPLSQSRTDGYRDGKAFVSLRNSIAKIARGVSWRWVIEDKNQTQMICIWVCGVYELAENRPLLALFYGFRDRDTPAVHTFRFIHRVALQVSDIFTYIRATPEEMALFRKVLYINSTLIEPDFFETSRNPSEKSFKVSFLVPMCSLTQQDARIIFT